MPRQPSGFDSVVEVRQVDEPEWPTALRTLFLSFPAEEREPRIAATLKAVEQGTLNLSGLRQAWRDSRPVGVSLTMFQPDRVTLVWPPVVDPAELDVERVFDVLLADVCQRLDGDGSRLGQILLDATDHLTAERLRRGGFCWQTNLFFLVRSLQEPFPAADTNVLLHAETYSSGNSSRFARLLESTYRGSLDCPLMEGLRTGEEALASHKLSGTFDAELWRIFTVSTPDGGRSDDVGLCLLNEHPDQDAVELVYFGVAPEYRGRGLGQQLLIDALQRAALRGRAALFLAVDAQNDYANKIYGDLGFVELARRTAHFRPASGLARQSSTRS